MLAVCTSVPLFPTILTVYKPAGVPPWITLNVSLQPERQTIAATQIAALKNDRHFWPLAEALRKPPTARGKMNAAAQVPDAALLMAI